MYIIYHDHKSPAYCHNAPCWASYWLIGCRGDTLPFPSQALAPTSTGEVMRRHLTLSAFGCNRLACAGADEQSHQTLMCKSNKRAEVQRAGVKLDRKTAPSLSLNQSVNQCVCIIQPSLHHLGKLHHGGKLSPIKDQRDIM